MDKEQWRKRAWEWKDKALYWKKKALSWKEGHQDIAELRDIWKKRYEDCKEDLEECEEESDPQPNPAIKTLSIKNGKFVVNGKVTKLIGVSKREMIGVGSGDKPLSEVNYTYPQIKKAILGSKINYIRVIAPKDLVYFRKEIKEYLQHGIVVEVELFDAGKKDGIPWQANWEDTFNAVKDLPVFFDAHNEFMDYNRVAKVNTIANCVVAHGGLVSAGARGASNHGEKYAKEFKAGNNKYQIVSHHQKWNKTSIEGDREPGKPLVWNEIHTRDNNLEATKRRLKLGSEICEGVQVYSLLNFGMGPGSKLQKILDYAGSLVK